MKKQYLAIVCTLFFTGFASANADECLNRGSLDKIYCDNNHDLVADTPTNPKLLKTPSTIVFTYTPVEDPAVYADIFSPFTNYLSQCMDKRVVFFQVQNNSAEVEAMRSGRLHVGGFSTGPTTFAVNLAGAVPFAARGNQDEFQGYNLIAVVKADSAYETLSDLKGKRLVHSAPSSNSGHMAPVALFPEAGITPGEDYKIIFSGKHDQSVMGVRTGDYDGAAVASDVFERMIERGQIKAEDFRVIYRSPKFPTSSFAYSHDLEPNFRDKMVQCFYDYRFPSEMQIAFDGADRFYPISYEKDWEIVRKISEAVENN
ncbi:phosphate/phosphite/phosphonate ABC transporter substrate-binding protein [Ignatzschineria sp. LJL83]